MKINLVFKKEIDVSDTNDNHCGKCEYLTRTWHNSIYTCRLFDYIKLENIADGKPFPQTFLRCIECISRSEQLK